jgi:fimbrial chaperone protein
MTHILKHFLTGCGAAILMAGGGLDAHASSIGVEPLFLEIAPSQSAAIRVRNTSENAIPVEVLVFKRDVDAVGNQTRIPADDDFIIFPPQASLKAAGTQVFRLRPLDNTKTKSQSYYVSFRQVPAPLEPSEESGARIQVVFSFDAAVHVVPRKAKSDAILKTAKKSNMSIQEATGEVKSLKNGRQVDVMREAIVPAIEIELENSGNKYLYLHEQEFTASITDVSGETSTHKWVNDDVSKHVKVTLVEPNEARTFTLPLPKGVNPSKVDVSVRKRREF